MITNSIESQIESKLIYMLSCLDRDPFSKTYGCFDRLYWGWKLKDHADISLQRMVYPTAKILTNLNILDDKHLKWIIASVIFVQKKMHYDGSIDQAFYGEHSHAATGFLLFDITNLYILIKDLLNQEEENLFLLVCTKMGSYLLNHDENHGLISNHLLGVAASLMNAHLILKNEKYKIKSLEYMDRVIDNQSIDGYYIEYEGADPGYQSLAIYYLSSIYTKYPTEKIKNSLYKAVEFISYFIHPDGSFGGEYGSRNTEILYCGGIALLCNENTTAANIINFMLDKYANHQTVSLDCIDDGNLSPLLNNFLLLNDYEAQNEQVVLPFRNNFTKEYKDIGISIYSDINNYSIVNIKKGGVLKVYDKINKKKIIDHCGFVYKDQSHFYTTSGCEEVYKKTQNCIRFKAKFSKITQPIPTTFTLTALKIYYLFFHRSYFMREIFKKQLVNLLISKKSAPSHMSDIEISFDKNVQITILDHKYDYINNTKFSTIHMASSKYYQLEGR